MKSYLKGMISVSGMNIPLVSEKTGLKDFLGAVMVRWGINRNKYRIDPGLYAIAKPDSTSDVFVTANYKLTFDSLRKSLSGINGWIMVLDTKGVTYGVLQVKGHSAQKNLLNG
jgi:CO dehydrogenase/acetyl-CoA synthase gamma subunit (corrinoid Fe-S protein)